MNRTLRFLIFVPVLVVIFAVVAVPSTLRGQTDPVKITGPANGSIVAPGDSVLVTVIGENLDSVFLATSTIGETATKPPFTFTLSIPNDAVGSMLILALGKDRSGNMHTDEIKIIVRPTASLESLDLEPSAVRFSGLTGLQQQVTVNAMYSDGVQRDVTSAETGTSYHSDNPNVVTVDEDGLLEVQGNGEALITVTNVTNPGAFATVTVIVDSPRLPFLEFEIERARVTLNYGNSKFEVRGRFVLDATSNGIDVLNEDVTVRFGTLEPFIIPAGSFLRKDDDDDEEFEYEGPSGGITKMKIETEKDRKRKKGRRLRGKTRRKIREKKDGKIEFKVEARGLDLGDIDLNNPVLFSLQIGFDYSQRRISFDDSGRFRRDNDDHQIKKFNDRDRGRRGKRDHRIKKHGHERHDD